MVDPAGSYAAGNDVYGGGSPQATMGTTDPSGYVDRSLNNPSSSRSGLAQAAISRLQSANAGPATGAASYGGTPIGQNGANDPATMAMQGQQAPVGAIPQVKITPLNVNPTGQISLPPSQSLPLDADLSSQTVTQTEAANAQLAAMAAQEEQIATQYTQSAHTAADALPGTLNTLLANYGSGRGLGFSSGYGNAYNNDQTAYMNQLNQLNMTAQNGITGLQTQEAAVPTTLDQAIQSILATQATRNAAAVQAGGVLGLGTPAASTGAPTSVVVNNAVDMQEALAAGYSPAQIINLSANPNEAIPQGSIYAGKAATGAPAGSTLAQGADRNATEQLLAQLRGGTAATPNNLSSAASTALKGSTPLTKAVIAAPGATYSGSASKQSNGAPINTQLASEIKAAGFQGQAANEMYSIVMAESGGNPTAHNGNANTGDNSYGLAQVNMLGQMGLNRLKQFGLTNDNQLLDPATNLKAAYAISSGGRNFSPWTTYTSGKNKTYMPVGSI